MTILARIIAAASLIFMGAGTAAFAQAEVTAAQDTAAAVERLFGRDPIQPDWFDDAFLREVPASQISDLIGRMTGEFGDLTEVTGSGEALVVHLAEADVPTTVRLDSAGRISTLFFQTPVPTKGTLEDHVAAIAALPGKRSVVVMSNGEIRAAYEPDAMLAVASAAKLAILKALEDAVTRGELHWDQVVQFDPAWRSLPTGILQDWPKGTALTVETLANLMISISDNTATDALIGIVGRDAIETVTPRNAPFVKTLELFKLKASEDGRREWADADEPGRRALLDRLQGSPAPLPGGLTKPAPEIEWFMSARELCDLIGDVGRLRPMRINPGLADPGDWASVAFKGGSEPGVLNYTTLLTGEDGAVHCVAATWNADEALDEARLAAPYRGILRALFKTAKTTD
jgi:beta-lactamase class A